MRLGKITDETVRSFQSLSRPLNFNDGLEVTELQVATLSRSPRIMLTMPTRFS